MGNIINRTGLGPQLKHMGPAGKKRPDKAGQSPGELDALKNVQKDFDLTLSGSGKNMAAQKNAAKNFAGVEAWNASPDEEKLSAKAKDYLAKLREQYGDYDFFIADDVENPLDLAGTSQKKYSVMLSSAELERMADDEEYAQKIMGQVQSAVDTLNGIQDQGGLGEGVRFKRLAISFDEDGNTKLFAELERMTEQQKERMEKAMEKRAAEKKAATRDYAKAPPTRPTVPSYQELTLAIKASIQYNSLTSEKVMDLLQTGLSNGNNNNLKGHALASQSVTASSTSVNIEIEAKLSTASQEGIRPDAHRHGGAPVHHGHHDHGVHGHYHQPAFHRPEHGHAGNTVRIEAGSAAELIEKANSVNWDS